MLGWLCLLSSVRAAHEDSVTSSPCAQGAGIPSCPQAGTCSLSLQNYSRWDVVLTAELSTVLWEVTQMKCVKVVTQRVTKSCQMTIVIDFCSYDCEISSNCILPSGKSQKCQNVFPILFSYTSKPHGVI